MTISIIVPSLRISSSLVICFIFNSCDLSFMIQLFMHLTHNMPQMFLVLVSLVATRNLWKESYRRPRSKETKSVFWVSHEDLNVEPCSCFGVWASLHLCSHNTHLQLCSNLVDNNAHFWPVFYVLGRCKT